MIQLEYQNIWSIDESFNEARDPSEPSCFYLYLEVGETGDKSNNVFNVRVANLAGAKQQGIKRPKNTKGLIVVYEYNWPKIKQLLEDILKECQANDWDSSMSNLAKHFDWDYEKMRPI